MLIIVREILSIEPCQCPLVLCILCGPLSGVGCLGYNCIAGTPAWSWLNMNVCVACYIRKQDDPLVISGQGGVAIKTIAGKLHPAEKMEHGGAGESMNG